VRIRSLAKQMLLLALLSCAAYSYCSRFSDTISSLPLNGVQLTLISIQEEPAFSSPISTESLPIFDQSEVGNVLWSSASTIALPYPNSKMATSPLVIFQYQT
jgi:hypothetical protein